MRRQADVSMNDAPIERANCCASSVVTWRRDSRSLLFATTTSGTFWISASLTREICSANLAQSSNDARFVMSNTNMKP